ncbi:hypothetical protein MMC12_001552 [Toensbergia leucococca]|nr:hypothetical protein [Toensbergia leucococca]
MGSSTVTLICTLIPKAGKLDRLEEVLTSRASEAHANEAGNLKYVVWVQAEADCEDGKGCVVLFEEWASRADLDNHHTKDYLHKTHKTLEDEDLLTNPEEIKRVKEVKAFWT